MNQQRLGLGGWVSHGLRLRYPGRRQLGALSVTSGGDVNPGPRNGFRQGFDLSRGDGRRFCQSQIERSQVRASCRIRQGANRKRQLGQGSRLGGTDELHHGSQRRASAFEAKHSAIQHLRRVQTPSMCRTGVFVAIDPALLPICERAVQQRVQNVSVLTEIVKTGQSLFRPRCPQGLGQLLRSG
ncbi:MAG TPA: hypothetical protein VGF45_17330, partial [Polyangia bacterium]